MDKQRPLYPAMQQPNGENDTSKDEQMARELQTQLNREHVVVAAPLQPAQVPFSCGACGTTHAVRNVTHGAMFTCTVCGVENRILLQQHQPVVVVQQISHSQNHFTHDRCKITASVCSFVSPVDPGHACDDGTVDNGHEPAVEAVDQRDRVRDDRNAVSTATISRVRVVVTSLATRATGTLLWRVWGRDRRQQLRLRGQRLDAHRRHLRVVVAFENVVAKRIVRHFCRCRVRGCKVQQHVLAVPDGAGLHLVVQEAERRLHALGHGRDRRVLARVVERARERFVERHVHFKHLDLVLARHRIRAVVGAREREVHAHELRLMRRTHEPTPEVKQVRGARVAAAAVVLAERARQQLEVLGHALVLLPRAARRVLVLGALDRKELAVRAGDHAVIRAHARAVRARPFAAALAVVLARAAASHYICTNNASSSMVRNDQQHTQPFLFGSTATHHLPSFLRASIIATYARSNI
ncbi:hypothetical protein FI667_g11199, partial [Globisporangium splendens]